MPATTDKKIKVVVNKEKQVKRDPVVPSSNKLVSARWEDKCREIHLQKLKNMKPAIDNVPPKEYPHLTNNKKRMQLQEGAHRLIFSSVFIATRHTRSHMHISLLCTSCPSACPLPIRRTMGYRAWWVVVACCRRCGAMSR